ncbi:MAG TPA: tetratricopeptide repeat protein, partial [Myxococcaceae bacterium]|nr:tetratricopeptide repeat protein [Myxococcaceae bacterium]
ANLGAALYKQGAYADACRLQEKELAGVLARLGEHNHETVISRENLAATMTAQGDYSNARIQLEQALVSSKHFYGPKHPYTTRIAGHLFAMFCKLRDRVGSDSVLFGELRWLVDEDPRRLAPEQQELRQEVLRIFSRI